MLRSPVTPNRTAVQSSSETKQTTDLTTPPGVSASAGSRCAPAGWGPPAEISVL